MPDVKMQRLKIDYRRCDPEVLFAEITIDVSQARFWTADEAPASRFWSL